MVMPEMSGPALAAQLRLQFPAVRVLYMSGYADDALVRQGLLGVGSRFIQKPFTANDLLHRVREALDIPSMETGDE
jgi:FixJ family two-component response regulator